jgi:hypothetical protein
MTWEPLSARLATLPFVLAGPILRKVDETSVTVWLATRIGATVELSVLDVDDTELMKGERRTIAIGRNLDIVAVTATMLVATARLSEGIVYRYNLSFALDNNTSCGLAEATHNARLGYPNKSSLPSFSLPPRDLNLLRLIQGSCRNPYGTGRDMLPRLHSLIAEYASHATFAYARPHQLLLTGNPSSPAGGFRSTPDRPLRATASCPSTRLRRGAQLRRRRSRSSRAAETYREPPS